MVFKKAISQIFFSARSCFNAAACFAALLQEPQFPEQPEPQPVHPPQDPLRIFLAMSRIQYAASRAIRNHTKISPAFMLKPHLKLINLTLPAQAVQLSCRIYAGDGSYGIIRLIAFTNQQIDNADQKSCCYDCPETCANGAADQAAQLVYDQSYDISP